MFHVLAIMIVLLFSRYGCYTVRSRVAAASVRTQQTGKSRGPSEALRSSSGEVGLVPASSADDKEKQIIVWRILLSFDHLLIAKRIIMGSLAFLFCYSL